MKYIFPLNWRKDFEKSVETATGKLGQYGFISNFWTVCLMWPLSVNVDGLNVGLYMYMIYLMLFTYTHILM